MSAATDAGAALRRALNAQLQQANAHSLLQDTKIKASPILDCCWHWLCEIGCEMCSSGSQGKEYKCRLRLRIRVCVCASQWLSAIVGEAFSTKFGASTVLCDHPLQELENELADCVEELRAAQRKLVVARTASSDAKPSLAGSGGASTATPAAKRCV